MEDMAISWYNWHIFSRWSFSVCLLLILVFYPKSYSLKWSQLNQKKRDLPTQHNLHTWTWGTSAGCSQATVRKPRTPGPLESPALKLHCLVALGAPHQDASLDQLSEILKIPAISLETQMHILLQVYAVLMTDQHHLLYDLTALLLYFWLICMPLQLK